jgi:hypothetical protein
MMMYLLESGASGTNMGGGRFVNPDIVYVWEFVQVYPK